jgi:hypothetical protein
MRKPAAAHPSDMLTLREAERHSFVTVWCALLRKSEGFPSRGWSGGPSMIIFLDRPTPYNSHGGQELLLNVQADSIEGNGKSCGLSAAAQGRVC